VKGGPLHIVRRRADALAAAMIADQGRRGPVGVVLVEDGVLANIPPGPSVWANADDVTARGITTPHRLIGYDEMAELVVAASRVTVW